MSRIRLKGFDFIHEILTWKKNLLPGMFFSSSGPNSFSETTSTDPLSGFFYFFFISPDGIQWAPGRLDRTLATFPVKTSSKHVFVPKCSNFMFIYGIQIFWMTSWEFTAVLKTWIQRSKHSGGIRPPPKKTTKKKAEVVAAAGFPFVILQE